MEVDELYLWNDYDGEAHHGVVLGKAGTNG